MRHRRGLLRFRRGCRGALRLQQILVRLFLAAAVFLRLSALRLYCAVCAVRAAVTRGGVRRLLFNLHVAPLLLLHLLLCCYALAFAGAAPAFVRSTALRSAA
jgi:hypothetical protein